MIILLSYNQCMPLEVRGYAFIFQFSYHIIKVGGYLVLSRYPLSFLSSRMCVDMDMDMDMKNRVQRGYGYAYLYKICVSTCPYPHNTLSSQEVGI